jgi:hypothetical protein
MKRRSHRPPMEDGSTGEGDMDDKDNNRSGYTLNTSGFTLEDLKLLQAALLDNRGLECSVHSRNRLYINSNSREKYIKLVKPHFHSSMLYKLINR